jgi:uncharacterized protein YycO
LKITNWKEAELKAGDLLFQQTNNHLSQAIRQVTNYGIGQFDHIGVLLNALSSKSYVIEATPDSGVDFLWLPEFLQKSHISEYNYRTVVARVKPEYQNIIPKVIEFLISKLFEPYNPYFDFEKNGYYCSQLVYEAFKYANDGVPFFETRPMTFVDPKTKKINSFWKSYFNKLGVEVPEGKEGINPNLIFSSDKIEFIYVFGEMQISVSA